MAQAFILVPDMTFPKTLIIAHRGAAATAPENTLKAFEKAWEQSAHGIEADFHLTRDMRILCHHDPSIKRRFLPDLKIADSNFADLRKRKSDAPDLEEVLASVPKGRFVFLEIKCGPEILPFFKNTLENSRLKKAQALVLSFDKHVVKETKKILPGIKTLWLTKYKKERHRKPRCASPGQVAAAALGLGADGVGVLAQKDLGRDFVGTLHEQGLEVHVWTVDDPDQAARYKKMGVESIITNQPGLIHESLYKPKV